MREGAQAVGGLLGSPEGTSKWSRAKSLTQPTDLAPTAIEAAHG